MELTQLLYFKTIAEKNNMSQAAETLHISQPALSQAVKKLEDELGIRLFERSKNKIVLNEAGKLALTYAQNILAKTEEMKNALSNYIHEDNLLSLGLCDPGPMRFAVPMFQKNYPDIKITSEIFANEDSLEELLLSRRYDAIISLKKPSHPDIITLPFAREELRLSLPEKHPLAQCKNICLQQENALNLAVYQGQGAYVRQLQPFLEQLKEKHTVKFYDDYFVFRQLLEQGNTATFTTRLVQQYRNDGANRVILPLTDEGINAVYQISYLRRNRKYLAPLLEWLQQNAALLQ